MTRQEEKQQLRAIVRRLEAALAPEYRAKSARSIAHRLLAMPEYQEAQTVFCFVGTDREIDTRPILEDALAAGKTLCVPLCTEPGRMESRQITDLHQLVPGRYGLWNQRQTRRSVLWTPSTSPCCPASPATIWDNGWAAAADIMTGSSPSTGAARYCCAGNC